MAHLVCAYQLRMRTDSSGNLVVRSDNIAVGLIVLLFGLVWTGLWIALLREDPDWLEMYQLWREPSRVDAAELGRLADDIGTIAKDSGIDMKPLWRPPRVSRDDPGGFDWGHFGVLAFSHGIPLATIVTGLWLMFAHTRLVFDAHGKLVRWERVRPFRRRRDVYEFSAVSLVLHPRIIPGKAWDWTGFALTLVAGDKRKLEFARNRSRQHLIAFAAAIQEAGIELRESPVEGPETRET